MVKETNTKRHYAPAAAIRICSGPQTTYTDGFFLLFFSVAKNNHGRAFSHPVQFIVFNHSTI